MANFRNGTKKKAKWAWNISLCLKRQSSQNDENMSKGTGYRGSPFQSWDNLSIKINTVMTSNPFNNIRIHVFVLINHK